MLKRILCALICATVLLTGCTTTTSVNGLKTKSVSLNGVKVATVDIGDAKAEAASGDVQQISMQSGDSQVAVALSAHNIDASRYIDVPLGDTTFKGAVDDTITGACAVIYYVGDVQLDVIFTEELPENDMTFELTYDDNEVEFSLYDVSATYDAVIDMLQY